VTQGKKFCIVGHSRL